MTLPTALAEIHYLNAGTNAASGTQNPSTAHTDVSLSQTVSATNGTNVMTFAGTINLTGVSDDDTDLIRVTGSSGERHLFRITAFTGGVSTCTGLVVVEVIGASGLSGSAWAIGGTRAVLEQDTSQPDMNDTVGGWHLVFANGETFVKNVQETWGGGALKATGPIIMRSEDITSSNRPTIDGEAGGAYAIRTTGLGTDQFFEMHGLRILNDGSSSTRVVNLTQNAVHVYISNCEIDFTGTTGDGLFVDSHNAQILIEDCIFTQNASQTSVSTGVNCDGGDDTSVIIRRCRFSNEGIGINIDLSGDGVLMVDDCIFDTNDVGINVADAGDDRSIHINQSSFYNAVNDGVIVSAATLGDINVYVRDCIIEDSGSYGVDVTDSTAANQVQVKNTAFYNNTSGQTNGTTDTDLITLSSSAFTDAASGDFSLNTAADGGALVNNEALEAAN